MDAIRDKFGDKIRRASVEKGPAQSLFADHLGDASGKKRDE